MSSIVFGDVESRYSPVQHSVNCAGQAHGGCVDNGQHYFNIFGHKLEVQPFVTLAQGPQVTISPHIRLEGMEVLLDAQHLFFIRPNAGRH